MDVHFIYDPSIEKKQQEIAEIIKTVNIKPISSDALFLKRFLRSCIFTIADMKERREKAMRVERFKKLQVKPRLPEPPRPITKLVPVDNNHSN